jgi:hypothetical protein
MFASLKVSYALSRGFLCVLWPTVQPLICIMSVLPVKDGVLIINNLEYGCEDPFRWPRETLYPQRLALTSPTKGGRSIGIVRSWTKAMKFVFMFINISKVPAYSQRTKDDSTHISSYADWTDLCVYLRRVAFETKRFLRNSYVCREVAAPSAFPRTSCAKWTLF